MKRLIPIFILFICMSANADPAQSPNNIGKPVSPQSMEILVNEFRPDNASTPSKKDDRVIYASGDNVRIERYEGEGSARKLVYVEIYKDHNKYEYAVGESEKMVMGGRSDLWKGKDILSVCAELLGLKWAELVENSKNPVLYPPPKKFEYIKQGSEKWNGIDCEVYKQINHYVSDVDYSMIYVDGQGIVRRVMEYKLKEGFGGGKPVLDCDWQAIKFEAGKPMPKDWLNWPADYKLMGG
jgi:hypothetical protein